MMKNKALKAALVGWGLMTSAAFVQAEVDSMVVFGDSLSDPGNFFQIFGEQKVQPFEAFNIPGAPYARGGHHFTNGETWIEQLSRDLKTRESGDPAIVAPGVFSNYAVGRSRARAELLDGVFSDENLSSQVDRFLADYPGGIPEDALYTIWIGSNDTADAILAILDPDSGPDGPAIAQAVIAAAVGNTADEMLRLYGEGARQFLVPNIPDFSLTPVFRNIAANACAALPDPTPCEQYILWVVSQTSTAYNGALALALTNLAQLPGISIQSLDVSGFMADVIADPGAYGFENANDACTVPATRSGAFCQAPHRYLFWDGQHPTRAGHRALADFAREQLEID